MTLSRALRSSVLTCALLLTAGSAFAAPADAVDRPVRYDGHAIVRVAIRSDADLQRMREISSDMWSHGAEVGRPADYRVSPEGLAALRASGIPFEIINPDISRPSTARSPSCAPKWESTARARTSRTTARATRSPPTSTRSSP